MQTIELLAILNTAVTGINVNMSLITILTVSGTVSPVSSCYSYGYGLVKCTFKRSSSKNIDLVQYFLMAEMLKHK